MPRNCKANLSRQYIQPTMSKESKSMNVTAWDGHKNDKQFMEALSRFMNESWAAVCQIRERSGLSSQYEMSSDEISKRINEVSKKLDEKYKEVQILEVQKAQLLSKSMSAPGPSRGGTPGTPVPASFQPIASSTPAHQQGYSGNYDMSYSGAAGGSSGWPSTTASPKRRPQYTQNSSASDCPPACSGGSSGQYQSFGGLDYGF